MNMGKRVESARLSLGYKQHDLAGKMGVSQQAIQKIEDGRTKMPRDVDKLATILNVSVEWLITGKTAPIYLEQPKEQEENKMVVELFSFLTASQKQSAVEFIQKLKSQNEQVFNELSEKMTAQKRMEKLYDNHAHA